MQKRPHGLYKMEHPLKVGHLISGDIWAGAEVQLFQTLLSLSEKSGFELLCVLFNDGILKQKLDTANIKNIVLDESRFSSLSLLFELKIIMKDFDPDLIHVHKVKEHFLGKLLSLFYLDGVPVIRTVHGAPKIPGCPSLFRYLRSVIVVLIDKYLIKNAADVVVAVSRDLERLIVKRKAKGKVYQIDNSINVKDYNIPDSGEIRKRYDVENRFWIGTAARLVEIKNIPMLIEAGKYLDERNIPFKISIFGEGPLKGALQNLIAESHLAGKVVLEGFEPGILPIIKGLDVFVLSSDHEGLPMALLEAMALRTPVICTEVGGMAEAIENGVNGLLVSPGDSKALAHAIITLYKDKGLAARLVREASKTIEDKYSNLKAGNRLYEIYDQLIPSNI